MFNLDPDPNHHNHNIKHATEKLPVAEIVIFENIHLFPKYPFLPQNTHFYPEISTFTPKYPLLPQKYSFLPQNIHF